jgi:hypothetical protein
MKEPGLDNRYRDQKAPRKGKIREKNGTALNKNLSPPFPGFGPSRTLSQMRAATGERSERDVRTAARKKHRSKSR